MQKYFTKIDNYILTLDPTKEMDKLVFHQYIIRKENLTRISKELPKGYFKLSNRVVAKDLKITLYKATTLIKCFVDNNVISIVKKGGVNGSPTIYSYNCLIEESCFVVQNHQSQNQSVELAVEKSVEKSEDKEVKVSNTNDTSQIEVIEKCEDLPHFKSEEQSISQSVNHTSKKDYLKKINKNIYSEVVDFLNLVSGKKFRANRCETKRLIDKRLSEGFDEDDFKKVIQRKVSQWQNTDMEKYIRPETLFSNKFEAYLNEISNKCDDYEYINSDIPQIGFYEDWEVMGL